MKRPMHAAEEYWRNAARCMGEAELAATPESRALLMKLADAWLRLAEQAEKNSRADLVYETPSPPPERTRPVVQQQQQAQTKKDETKE